MGGLVVLHDAATAQKKEGLTTAAGGRVLHSQRCIVSL